MTFRIFSLIVILNGLAGCNEAPAPSRPALTTELLRDKIARSVSFDGATVKVTGGLLGTYGLSPANAQTWQIECNRSYFKISFAQDAEFYLGRPEAEGHCDRLIAVAGRELASILPMVNGVTIVRRQPTPPYADGD